MNVSLSWIDFLNCSIFWELLIPFKIDQSQISRMNVPQFTLVNMATQPMPIKFFCRFSADELKNCFVRETKRKISLNFHEFSFLAYKINFSFRACCLTMMIGNLCAFSSSFPREKYQAVKTQNCNRFFSFQLTFSRTFSRSICNLA